MVTLTRDELIDGLRDLVRRLHAQGASASIRIVGGAAMLLRYDADRRVTADIDASIHSSAEIEIVVREIAAERAWPIDWLNTRASTFIPIATEPLWETLYDDGTISIWVAAPASLLAMKLKAARPGRDTDDIAALLSILNITTTDAAEAVFEHYYPGELPPDRAYRLVERIVSSNAPWPPDLPPSPEFGASDDER